MTPDLAAHGYHPSSRHRLWLRGEESGVEFGYNDGDEYETWVGRAVRDATDVSTQSRELRAGIKDWPSRYHLSSHRGNIVEPLLETMRGPVLEVGAGMGAVTRALGEHGLDVVAVEGSPRRAAICADRCRDLPNVQVVADTIQGFGSHTRFATVVMIGVLEYSRMFGFEDEGRDPVDQMIEHLSGLLLPGGQLVLAIENQLGLKYLAGFPEDHVGRRYFGVEDRYRGDTPVTFGRVELAARLAAGGLSEQEWYFPFPDYKLPSAVISEHGLTPESSLDPVPLVTASARGDHQKPATTAFELERAWGVTHRNGLLPDVSSSFLVRASTSPLEPQSTVAWYYGVSPRRPEFAKVTTFDQADGGLAVRRRRLLPDLPEAVGTIGIRLAEEEYRPGRPWTETLAHIVGQDGWSVNGISTWLGTWLTSLRAEADDVDPDDVPGHFLDALPRNLIVEDDGSTRFIDLEWYSTEPIPEAYLVFRALYDSLASLGPVAEPIEGTSLVLRDLVADVSRSQGVELGSTLDAHWERESEFQSTVLGASLLTTADTVLGAELPVRRSLDDVIAQAERAPALTEALATREATELELRAEIERRGAELDSRASTIEHLAADAERLSDERDLLAADTERLSGERDLLAAEITRLEADARLKDNDLDIARQLATRLEDEARPLVDGLHDNEELARGLAAELHAVRRTLSWRVTRPLRAARRVARGPVRLARGAVRRVRRASSALHRTATPAAPVVAAEAHSEAPADALAALELDYYRYRNPDLTTLSDAELRSHYRTFGWSEGRWAVSAFGRARHVVRELDPDRETVLVVFHDATRTGAPVLGWNLLRELGERYDVVAMLLDGGELAPDIEDVAAATIAIERNALIDAYEAEHFASRIQEAYRPVYAVANSAATYPLASTLERAGTPVVALVHEFASSMRPKGVLSEFFGSVSEVVFPAEIVADSMRREYADLLGREHRVIPQGQSVLPPGEDEDPPARITPLGPDGVDADLPESTVAEFLDSLEQGAVVVIGAGTIAPRKGIEFFVQTAALAAGIAPETPIRFAWIGHRVAGFQWYVEELWEQVTRSRADDRVTFLAPVSDLGPLYERADLFLLSSRLDPLPNVTIDAALMGVPVVAFDRASGFADWLLADRDLARLVVPHLDVRAAAEVVADLATDDRKRASLGQALRTAAEADFDMARYTEQVDGLGRGARAARNQRDADLDAILASGEFSGHLFAGAEPDAMQADLVARYVDTSRLAAPRARPRSGLLVRRPSEGFNPLVYAELAPAYDDVRDGDPFADFLRKGRPRGPWIHEVLRPQGGWSPAETPLRILLHGHFHYPELVPGLLERLGTNKTPVTLHLTTSSETNAAVLRRTLEAGTTLPWDVQVVPNRGRDLAPLVVGMSRETLDTHDLLLHVHGKRSPHVESHISRLWSDFLLENLVGGQYPMADRIHAAFASDPSLGLVFPEDPHLNDWDLNRPLGESLAARVGVTAPLPNHFDFPVGNMYWARISAIRPLFDAGFIWDEFPEEPLPIDGTMLHALERLTPFIVRDAGFHAAKTAVPDVFR